ncbi:NADH:flavin oxidoreductase [Flavobacterium rivuli WB 3.3-2 = DSM 21788]|uniref:NADH:flavin oxidoreductase n=1 Tax=Flavobacterium rivuli WB 3.3-2 = DSM 21788 TaxID=1121895 RepID=A0A0A2M3R7_9FLAO|nr:alkene reductase [Flavobacterium rivuli]KGO86924.1 NADH:flavin oxidoreductase [Flavobacterium rivuli WB 3.3-2 = DSM 21788]
MKKLFTPFEKGTLKLKNHLVMAPMTRSRAIGNLPNELIATYYAQRSGAGLIVTEGTSPSPEGLGYPRIPGIYSEAQVAGWKNVTEAVHLNGAKIFLQLMHTGRIANVANLPDGLQPVGPSNIKAAGEIFTDTLGMQEHSVPVALTQQGITGVIADFVQASKNVIRAGFDGVELHGANGYLLEQFLNPNVNNRADHYGGDLINRSRLIVEITEAIAAAIGADKIGIRFSPFSQLSDQKPYDTEEVHQTYTYLSSELDRIGLAYIHLSLNPDIPEKTYKSIRTVFNNTIIYCNALTKESAEELLQHNSADLVAFGRGFLANPDFVSRSEKNVPLNDVDFGTLYTPGEQGYIDYPLYTSK